MLTDDSILLFCWRSHFDNAEWIFQKQIPEEMLGKITNDEFWGSKKTFWPSQYWITFWISEETERHSERLSRSKLQDILLTSFVKLD